MEKGTINFNKAAAVALMAVFTLAICFIILGSISVELMSSLQISSGQFGNMVLTLFVTSCIVQLFIGPAVDKVGYKPVAIVGFILTGLSMLLLALSTTYSTALLSCVLLGIGAMSLNTVGNTLIPVVLFDGKDPARASNFGNAFFGLGFVFTPLLFVLMLNTLNLSYQIALVCIAILMMIFLVVSLTATFPRVSVGFKFSMVAKVLVKPAVIFAALALFCYMSLEISMATWIRLLMEELYGAAGTGTSAIPTGVVLSLFGASMMVGRFITSTVKNLTAKGPKLLILVSTVSLASIILMIVAGSPGVGIFAVIIAGLAFAPIFPTIVGLTFSKFDPSLYGTIFGIIFSIGLLGGTFVPSMIGNLIIESSVQQSLLIAAVMAGILIFISFLAGKTGKSELQ